MVECPAIPDSGQDLSVSAGRHGKTIEYEHKTNLFMLNMDIFLIYYLIKSLFIEWNIFHFSNQNSMIYMEYEWMNEWIEYLYTA